MMTTQISMRDRMLRAANLDELEGLRAKSRKYNNARPNTRHKWRRAFATREDELKAAMSEDELKARALAKAERELDGIRKKQ